MGDEISEWRAIGANPVPGDAPAGKSVRLLPDFEVLQAEIANLESASGRPVKWKEVVTIGKTILREQSKDLLVASYLSMGLFEEGGYAGLRAGLSCIEGMVITFWDSLYPEAKRMRGRINALNWLSEKVGEAVSRKAPEAGDKDLIGGCAQQVEELNKVLSEKMGPEGPVLMNLLKSLRDRLREPESQQPTAQPSPRAPAVTSQPKADAGAQMVSARIESLEDAKRIVRDFGSQIQRAAIFALKQDTSLAWPYRMIRAIAWGQMDAPPPDTDRKTMVPPPPAHLPNNFQGLADSEKWTEILDQAESQISASPLWLDLQRYSLSALTRMGETHRKAKEAVGSELNGLLKRNPGLLDLQFSNGMPFADDQTRNWIRTELSESGNTPSPPSTEERTTNRAEAGPGENRSEAIQLMKKGKFKEAAGLFQQELSKATTYRERFLARLAQAKICFEAGQHKMAVSQLEGMDRDIERFSLEEWEPDICVQVFQTLWRGLNRLMQDSKPPSVEIAKQAEDVYKKLARLDLVAALDLESQKKGSWLGR
jgi:type VI secretion system protein VasJ